ncbi:pullulanase-type alpha-1,6-glucosidase [Vibrio sp. VPAP30]|uniref:pullulanase-type alpha-1,6-glucosidase n=1 Tax=Vibrio sp. VPAP30 TaxID=1647102 RepID=UPI000B0FAE78|nr:pullulanase-type alpha-1,6-glucosidase [Vibrio sp. VPAP30]
MKQQLNLSTLTKAMLPVLTVPLLMACQQETDCTSPQQSADQINIPAWCEMPIEPEVKEKRRLISYIMAPEESSSHLSHRTKKRDWVLECGNKKYRASGSDEYGPYWLLKSRKTTGACTINHKDSEVISVTLDPQAKFQGITEHGEVVNENRRATLLTSLGLDQQGTDVKLPQIDAPGELAAPPAGHFAIQLYDPMGDYQEVGQALNGYANYNLHLWNNGTPCAAGDPAGFNNGWDDTSITPDAADHFGPIWYVPVTDDPSQCFNAIVRNGNKDKIIGSDLAIDISAMDTHPSVTFVPGDSTAYASRTFVYNNLDLGFNVDTVGAILLDERTLVWKGAKGADQVQLMFSEQGKYQVSEQGIVSALSIKLTPTSLSSEQKTRYPHLADYPAYEVPAALYGLVKTSLVAVASNSSGAERPSTLRAVTGVQYAGALDAMFAQEATELEYGAVYDDNRVTFRLWAPTAHNVELVVYDQNKVELKRYPMTEDIYSGSWSVRKRVKAVDGKYYRYAMKVFQPREQLTAEYEVTDPYSVSLAMNSTHSQAINLDASELKPSGWDALQAPHSQNEDNGDLANLTIYESHVRDFSAHDASTVNKGKYLAFTESGSVPVNHLKELEQAGMTHLHLMPVFDIATINEDPDQVANIDEPFSKLCNLVPKVNSDANFSGYCETGLSIADVYSEILTSDDKSTPLVQDLTQYVRTVDSYNWGYDPFHYTVPEGSYATDAEGTQRIVEFREMVQAVKQDIGMNVVVDVVYNHTNASGYQSDKSVLDKVVPLYYHRLVPDTGVVETSTCCENTAPEHAMFAKLIDDSIQTWVRDYKIDAFRWDLMGHHPLSQIQQTLAAARDINPDVYFYGEGWNFGEVADDKRFIQATQKHLGGTGIGSFSDRLRDAARGGSPFESGDDIRRMQGFATGAAVLANELTDYSGNEAETELARALHQADLIRLGMAGNLKTFKLIDSSNQTLLGQDVDYNGQAAGYADQPWEIQNYVSKHDNQTFWDINMYKVAESASTDVRVRMQTIGTATVLLGQAMPFNHMGGELLRSKSMQRDSYDFGDWYNLVDFDRSDNNWNKGLPAAEKDLANYEQIERAIADANTHPTPSDIDAMFANYKELLQLRQSSKLFTLPSGDEIISRVDFRNTGSAQTPGLIVMTVDNGITQSSDMDPNLDALVVMINATPNHQSFGHFNDHLGNRIELSGFELSDTHSQGNMSNGAYFNASKQTFEVPAWSVAVFEQARAVERGLGLPVSEKQGDLPPFGARKVYIAGGFPLSVWDPATIEVPYLGEGIYGVTLGLDSDTGYKFTMGSWDEQYSCGGGNCPSNYQELGMYQFKLDATNTVSPNVIEAQLVESYEGKEWFIPGALSGGWDHTVARKMDLTTSSLATFTTSTLTSGTSYDFKFTCGDWGQCEHGFDAVIAGENSLPFGSNSGNISFTPDSDGAFQVQFNVLTKALTISTL